MVVVRCSHGGAVLSWFGGAAVVVVARCSHGAAVVVAWCSDGLETLLPWHGRRCYQRRRTLLPTAAAFGDATSGDGSRRCYQRRRTLLSTAAGDATIGGGRCYLRWPAMLPSTNADGATRDARRCYKGAGTWLLVYYN